MIKTSSFFQKQGLKILAEIGNLKLILSFFSILNISVTWNSQINKNISQQLIANYIAILQGKEVEFICPRICLVLNTFVQGQI